MNHNKVALHLPIPLAEYAIVTALKDYPISGKVSFTPGGAFH